MQEGEIYLVDDSLPFLQGIEELLSTHSRNLVIEEVFKEDIDKALEEGDVKDSAKGDVTRVLCWNDDELPTKMVEPLA